MSKIFIMRHADAKSIKNFASDAERPLSNKGWEELEEIKPHLKEAFRDISLVLCSPSVRTRETLMGIEGVIPKSAKTHYLTTLYHAPSDTILEEINLYRMGHSNILLIGHNPGATEFLENIARSNFSGGYGETTFNMPTGSVVAYHYDTKKSTGLDYKDLTVECIFKN